MSDHRSVLPRSRALLSTVLAKCIAPGILLAGVTEAQAPRALTDLVLGASKRPIVELELGGDAFEGMPVFCEDPYILWPKGAGERLPTRDLEVTRRWIDRVAAELGIGGFQAHFVQSWTWRDNEVWSFGLRREGLELWDTGVQVHWAGERLVGIDVDVPRPLIAIEEIPEGTPRDGSWVLALRRDAAGYTVRPAAVRVQRGPASTTTTVGSQTVVNRTLFSGPVTKPTWAFTEWTMPVGTFPDQIGVDSQGKVWLSQPNQNFLTRFDPVTETFTQYSTAGGTAPDGMIVDSQDRKWTGLYNSGGLGMLDTNDVFTVYGAPYASPKMAIPVESSQGTIWVTDHERNRISEFDPLSSTWLGSYVMPSSGSWVVNGTEDTVNSTIYYTCYSVDKLAYKPLGQPILETNTPGSGPAFAVYHQGKVYYSLWNEARLGVYDIQANTHTLHAYPLPGEWGGPIGVTGDGRVVLGTRGNDGYIVVFEPQTSALTYYEIPTDWPGNLKDGIAAGQGKDVWFTETFANKLARLVLP